MNTERAESTADAIVVEGFETAAGGAAVSLTLPGAATVAMTTMSAANLGSRLAMAAVMAENYRESGPHKPDLRDGNDVSGLILPLLEVRGGQALAGMVAKAVELKTGTP